MGIFLQKGAKPAKGREEEVREICRNAREAARLVVFPYPREEKFGAKIRVKEIAPAADLEKLKITKLSIGDQRNLGAAQFKREGDSVVLEFGDAGVGRYVIEWN